MCMEVCIKRALISAPGPPCHLPVPLWLATGQGYLGRTRFTDSPQITLSSCLLNIFKGFFAFDFYFSDGVDIFIYAQNMCFNT